jgi:hypothetical protein
MANVTDRDPRKAQRRSGQRAIEKLPVEARQGLLGRPVLWVLVSSLALAVAAYVILHYYFFDSIL